MCSHRLAMFFKDFYVCDRKYWYFLRIEDILFLKYVAYLSPANRKGSDDKVHPKVPDLKLFYSAV